MTNIHVYLNISILLSFAPALYFLLLELFELSHHYFRISKGVIFVKDHHLPLLWYIGMCVVCLFFFIKTYDDLKNTEYIVMLFSVQILMVTVGVSMSYLFFCKNRKRHLVFKSNKTSDNFIVPGYHDSSQALIKNTVSTPSESEIHELTKLENIDFSIKSEISQRANEIFDRLVDMGVFEGSFNVFKAFLNAEESVLNEKIKVKLDCESHKAYLLFFNSFFKIPLYSQYQKIVSDRKLKVKQDDFNSSFLSYLDKYFEKTVASNKKSNFISMQATNLFNNIFKSAQDDELKKYYDLLGL